MRKAAVIGGGAAGMMTAVLAAGGKTEIHLYEKNEKLGKKLFITGKGRCNVTNDCPTEEFFTNVVTNPKFLYSSAYSFDSAQVQEFFEAAGVRLKVERGNRVFPESDHSSDIIRALEMELKRKNVQVHKNTKVKELLFEGDRVKGIRLENGKELFYDDVAVHIEDTVYAFGKILRRKNAVINLLRPSLFGGRAFENFLLKGYGTESHLFGQIFPICFDIRVRHFLGRYVYRMLAGVIVCKGTNHRRKIGQIFFVDCCQNIHKTGNSRLIEGFFRRNQITPKKARAFSFGYCTLFLRKCQPPPPSFRKKVLFCRSSLSA